MATQYDSSTFRAPVRLPAMPDEDEAARSYPAIRLERSAVVDGRLEFDNPGGFEQALAHGFFLVRMEDDVDTSDGDSFASHFFERSAGDALDTFRDFKDTDVPGEYQGYFDREHDQWENFYIERGNWQLLPKEVAGLGDKMANLGIEILRSVLSRLNLPEKDWLEVTGGLTGHGGHQMLAFNHFRPEKEVRGSKFHRDSGWVTVLRSTAPGLLVWIDGELHSVNPEPGYFIVNFGSSIEVLTWQLPTPVRANIHGVARTVRGDNREDRTSYVIFLDSRLDGSIYSYEDGAPRRLQSVAEFAEQEVNRTYNGEDIFL